jgi:hypothetical protein
LLNTEDRRISWKDDKAYRDVLETQYKQTTVISRVRPVYQNATQAGLTIRPTNSLADVLPYLVICTLSSASTNQETSTYM